MPDERSTPPMVVLARPRGPSDDAVERSLRGEFAVVVLPDDGEDVADASARLAADIVILDVRRRVFDVLSLVERVKLTTPHVRVVLLADDLPDDVVVNLMRFDVEGLLVNPSGADAIAAGIRLVAAGALALDQWTLRRAAKALAIRITASRELAGVLTSREFEVARLVGAGLTTREIAARLFVTEGTVKVHLHKTFTKLKFRTRRELADYMRQKGLA